MKGVELPKREHSREREKTYVVYPRDARLVEWFSEYMSSPSRSDAVRDAIRYMTDLVEKQEAQIADIEVPSYVRRAPFGSGKGRNMSVNLFDEDHERMIRLTELLGCSPSETMRTVLRVYSAFLAQQAK